MSEEIDDIHESPETKSFISEKAGYELFGKPLHGYSPSRKVAAQAMGMLYPYVGEEGAMQMETTGRYPGQLKDMAIVLWLCTLPDPHEITKEQIRAGVWTPARAIVRKIDALMVAWDWAAAESILTLGSKEEVAANDIFMAIITGLSASEFRIQVEGANSAPPPNDSPNV